MSLNLVLKILQRRSWIVGLTFLATMAGALLLLLLIPSRYDATAMASIDPGQVDPVSGVAGGSAANSVMIMQGNLIALAKSNQVAVSVVKRLNMASDPGAQANYAGSADSGLIDIQQWLANQLGEHVKAEFMLGSNVLTITYKGASPQQSASLANAFMSAFNDAAIAAKVAASTKASDWYAPQLENVRDRLAAARNRLAKFQSDSKTLIPTAGDTENEQLMAATTELTQAKAGLVALQNQYSAPAPTTAAASDPQSIDIVTINNLHASLSNIEADVARLQVDVGVNNPKLLEKLALRASLQKQTQQAIEDYRRKLAERIANQTERVATLQKVYTDRLNNMIGVQGQREQLISLTREVAFHQDELERLQRAASQARLQSQLSFSNIALIDPAAPPTSIAFPKPFIIVPLAAILGLGLGLLLALIAEALDRRLRAADDLPFATNAPLLGVMIDIKPKKPSRWSNLIRRIRLPRWRGPRPPASGDALARS
ncbi:GNVR domain-containing protein [uncultured Rhodoblastus sp.]|uniref:GNVR domain-containing protein n=1 Tax=uncultured Rhodoblastus sp. TaxID=543037 RepID=UPI0025D49389|nr:GNVR domain-containing protein [uncultured Rhodoblastus sp.]